MKNSMSHVARALACATLATTLLAQRAFGDGSSGFEAWVNGLARPVAFQSDGKMVVGGKFSSVNGDARKGLVRLDSTGSVDPAFNPQVDLGHNYDYGIFSLLSLPEGKFLVGGRFTNMNGFACKGLARINSDGSTDTNFTSQVSVVSTLIPQTDGKFIIEAYINDAKYPIHPMLGRIESNGALDASFFTNLPNSIIKGGLDTVALQTDGKILVGGHFPNSEDPLDGASNFHRLNSDGTMDLLFNPALDAVNVRSVGVQPGGRIIVSVVMNEAAGYRSRILGLHPDGTIDETFAVDASHEWELQAVQPDGKLLAASITDHGDPYPPVVRLNVDGTVDSSFHSIPWTHGPLAFQADGKIITGGGSLNSGGQSFMQLIRLNTDGTPDSLAVLDSLSVKDNGSVQLSPLQTGATNLTVLAANTITLSGNGEWQILGHPTPNGSNTLEVSDPAAATNAPIRFYRVLSRSLLP
ncbi:MAG TPA: delta-60 repeat domain-containing protein [Candidatus Limnocylindria bacterium]|nr:delta-60 repeat domain-containing protein [Candidatus Limnocylindria bacterium]